LLASGLGSGYARVAPGTWGTLAALPFWIAAQSLFPSLISAAVLLALVLFVGFFAVNLVLLSRANLESDPQWIVIDEWAGVYLALVAVPFEDILSLNNILWIGSAVILFRALDIAKPGPVGWGEVLPGAWGIMADDLIAGAIAAGMLAVVRVVLI
jgi:phosphatidylglycerophosphatase A